MASQRITIAKIGGVAGDKVLSKFRAWNDARISTETESLHEQWPTAVRRQVDQFAAALKSNDGAPPVLYSCEHVDLWSMGDLWEQWLPDEPGHEPIKLETERLHLWCYPLPDDGVLVKLLKRALRRKRIRERADQEDRWFILNLLEATFAWEGLVDRSVLVIIREFLVGGCVLDDEVRESLEEVPDWLNRFVE